MTFKELKTLVEKYQKEQEFYHNTFHYLSYYTPGTKAYEDISKGLQATKNKRDGLLEKIKPYMQFFILPAYRLQAALKQAYNELNTKAKLKTTVLISEIPILNSLGTSYIHDIETSLILGEENISYSERVLFNFKAVQTGHPENEEYFTKNQHEVNLWNLLEDTLSPDWEPIHKACWIAVEKRLTETKKVEISKQSKEKNLLVKKLELLKDENKRNLAIASMEKQITEIDKIIEDYNKSSDNVSVDMFKC